MSVVETYLGHVEKNFPDLPQNPFMEMIYLLRDHGQHFKLGEKVRPEGMKKMEDKMCFRNCAELSSGTLTYCEGFVVPDFIDLPIHHAWLVGRDGVVIDPTWKTLGVEYFGLHFSRKFLLTRLLKQGTYGLLDNSNLLGVSGPEEFGDWRLM